MPESGIAKLHARMERVIIPSRRPERAVAITRSAENRPEGCPAGLRSLCISFCVGPIASLAGGVQNGSVLASALHQSASARLGCCGVCDGQRTAPAPALLCRHSRFAIRHLWFANCFLRASTTERRLIVETLLRKKRPPPPRSDHPGPRSRSRTRCLCRRLIPAASQGVVPQPVN